MKSLVFPLLLLLSVCAGGQTVKYTVLDDDPMHLKKTEIDLSALGIDFIVPRSEFGEGDVSINANLRVQHFPIKDKFGVDFNLQLSAALITEVNYRRTNLSVTYALGSKQKKEEQSFVLGRKSTSSGYVQTTTTRFINIPQTRQKNLELRAGYSGTKGTFARVPIQGHANPRYVDYRSHGISAGIQVRRFFHQRIKLNNRAYTNSNTWILYSDVLFMPVTSYSPRGTGFRSTPTKEELRQAVKDAGVRSTLGGLIGFKYTGNRQRLFGVTFGGEVGILAPNNSLVINTFWGLPINF
ncbi:MAG: hypothetical protein JJ975_17755 [Bacteroidia bacterium]|nr:hypothetical protein [Bacteroidia bacterium]